MSRARRLAPFVIAGLALLAEGYALALGERSAQGRTMLSFAIAFAAALLLFLWLVGFSGLSRRARARAAGLVLSAVLAASLLFRIRGVTGDFFPILEPRWQPRERLPAAAPPPVTQPSEPPVAPQAGAAPLGEPQPSEPTSAPRSDGRASGRAEAREPAGPAPGAAAPSSPSTPVQAADSAPRTLADYPQFLGPDRDGTLRGAELAHDWSARPPRLVWRQAIGLGWSAFAIQGQRAVTQEQRGQDELVTCYELATGKLLWAHADRVRFDSVIAGDGPRAAPTIAAGRVYTMGSTGLLNALDLATGRRIWSHDVVAEHGAGVPDFGKASSPLVVQGLVIVSAGGSDGRSLVAYRAEDGAPVWAAGGDRSGYSSPALVSLLEEPQVVSFNQKSVAAHDPATGRILWEHAWPAGQPNVAQPLPVAADRVLVSSGYGIGSKLFEVARAEDGSQRARIVWETTRLKSKFVNMLLLDGHVYGLDDGVFTCLDLATGERKWRAGRYGHGQMILVERTLLVQTEEGELVLVEPSPDGLVERARFQALDDKTWNPPALAPPFLLVRNDKEAALYELPLAARP